MPNQINIEYLTTRGWTKLTDGSWLPSELIETNCKACTFEMAMHFQTSLDGETPYMKCLEDPND